MQKARLEELDLLRGLSVIGMILVITPGAWGIGYPWLNHADWEGIVAVDMIAPAFMFCVGFAIPLALKNRIEESIPSSVLLRQILQRGMLLILLGIFIHWTGNTDFSTIRIPGVLQRIGLTFIVVSLILLFLGRKTEDHFSPDPKQLAVITAILLLGLWLFFYLVPAPGASANDFSSDSSWASFIDQSVFGIAHMWEWGQTEGLVTYDPDGLICSLATCGNVLIGSILGVMYQQQSPHYTKTKVFGLGIALIALGLAFSIVCPIIKKIWTSSFVLVSSGVSVLAFVTLWSIKDYQIVNKLSHPLYAYGANALFGFTISWLGLFWFLNIPIVEDQSLRDLGFNAINSLVASKPLASLFFGISFIGILYLVLAYMLYRRWYIKL